MTTKKPAGAKALADSSSASGIDVKRVGEWFRAHEKARRSGDTRAIAEFVRKWGLQDQHERDTVAALLDGTFPIPDRRTHQATSAQFEELLAKFKAHQDLFGQRNFTNAYIYRALDKHFGYADGTSKRKIARSKKGGDANLK